ncbi:MAG: hypothetical protein ACQETL_10180 [Bacteroidota bacterium]
MKTYPNILKPVKQYVLIGLIVLITLLGFTIKANAQSPLVGNDLDKINNSVTVQLAEFDFDVIIPKITQKELQSMEGAIFNQMVFVSDGEAGYYSFKGTKWEMKNVREVFELIELKLSFQEPNTESLILFTGEEDAKSLLDYNFHVNKIYKDFGIEPDENALAMNLEKE